jgi:hypothetical protein
LRGGVNIMLVSPCWMILCVLGWSHKGSSEIRSLRRLSFLKQKSSYVVNWKWQLKQNNKYNKGEGCFSSVFSDHFRNKIVCQLRWLIFYHIINS